MDRGTGRKFYEFREEMRRAYEMLNFPLAVYQERYGKIQTLLVSDGLVHLVGKTREELIRELNSSMFRNIHPDDAPRIAEIGTRFAAHLGSYDVLYRVHVSQDSAWHTFHTVGFRQTMEDGTELAFLYYMDLTGSSQIIQKLNGDFDAATSTRMYRDRLTGLPNLDFFYRFGAEFRNDFLRRQEMPVLVVLRLAHLHEYNSLYGFEAGDALLTGTAKILQEVFSGDLVVRGPGNRFYVVSEERTTEEKVISSQKKITEIALGDTIQIWAGLCRFPENLSLSKALDLASTAAKSIEKSGRECFCWFDSILEQKRLEKSYILDCFSRARREHWIQVYYQPIVDSKNGRICHFEALARWKDPKHGLLAPDVFVPVLEETHRISELDFYMLEEVCREMQREQEEGYTCVPVSVNYCAEDFMQENALEKTMEILKRYHIPVCRIVLEVTEREIAPTKEAFRDRIDLFRRAGFSIWVDDFGSGYSSLNVMNAYHFDLIKLDMAFTRQLASGKREDQTIVRAILDCARDLGIHTLAEGVETKEQSAFLASAGCELQQGYHFGKPEPRGDDAPRK